ncbi:MAG TPA: NBR1-Ig-like domain-containing protein, partial [Anaerolineales bacterium]|nr:NBR1-Ig-like domain-containing protein [Anaerolineales bacterium]
MKHFKLLSIFTGVLIFLSACNSVPSLPIENTQQPATLTVNSPVPSATMESMATEIITPTAIPATATVTSTSPTQCTNAAEFISDVSIPDGTNLMTDTDFVKTWRVKNTGTCTWDSRYSLVFTDGTLFSSYDRITLPFVVAPGQTADLSLDMTSPIYPGVYESDWKFQAPNGIKFGVGKKDSPLWVKITVGQQGGTTISGFVYQDRNGNSKYDFDDQLMASREVWLQQGSCELGGPRTASGVSGGDGRYTITGNFSGKYCVSLKRPDETVYTLNVSVTSGQRFDGADM